MKTSVIYQGSHEWVMFGRDENKAEKIIDTNQYLVSTEKDALLLDPGGIELFAPMLSAIIKHVPLERVTQLFASHQDPDIISSLGLWDQILTNGTLHSPWLWEGFIRHFGMNNIRYEPIPDEGKTLHVGGLNLQLIPAHYLHSSGNFHIYDPVAKILFSGDVGAALEGPNSPMYVEDFDLHAPKMELFHRRWMPSNSAKNDWINRVRKLDIEMMLPQHGRIFRGDDIPKFLNWFENLSVGSAIEA